MSVIKANALLFVSGRGCIVMHCNALYALQGRWKFVSKLWLGLGRVGRGLTNGCSSIGEDFVLLIDCWIFDLKLEKNYIFFTFAHLTFIFWFQLLSGTLNLCKTFPWLLAPYACCEDIAPI